jgi:hypothetical protein
MQEHDPPGTSRWTRTPRLAARRKLLLGPDEAGEAVLDA